MRAGTTIRIAAAASRLSKSEVQRWVDRAKGQSLADVDWTNRARVPKHTTRTPDEVESRVLSVRDALRTRSVLGEYGARAVQVELERQSLEDVPSLRTIGRIFERSGVLDGQRRLRRPPPPPGWYLPRVAAGIAELDSFDVVTGLVIQGGIDLEVLNGISLHGGIVCSWATRSATAKFVAESLLGHWREVGLPSYAQFDNDTRFQGAHQHRGVVGTVARLCLALKVTPVFAPPRETGFQASIESYNGRWQAKVWSRFHHPTLRALQLRSNAYVHAHRRRTLQRRDRAARREFGEVALDSSARPMGKLIYLRRTNGSGRADLLGDAFHVDKDWVHRLVRAEVDLAKKRIRFFALRRRDPTDQPILAEVPYDLPLRTRPFNYGH